MRTRKAKSLLRWLTLLLLMLLPAAVFAQGQIDTEQDSSVTLHYLDEKTPVPEAAFALYRVADISATGKFSLTGEFTDAEKYPISLDCEDTAAWLELASTLKGLVQKHAAVPQKTAVTGTDGSAAVSGLKPGLFLVLGNPSRANGYDYTPVPFMTVLPQAENAGNSWDYDIDTVVKYEKVQTPPSYETRKVIKDWNDAGKADARPSEITVELLCDGKSYETVTLNAANNWRHTWDKLEGGHDWSLVEKAVPGYTTTVVPEGITFKVTNTPTEPPHEDPSVTGSIPVQKKISGDTPNVKSAFTFILEPADAAFPMPAGSANGRKELRITGAGSGEFGPLYFTKPGVYTYTVTEVKGSVSGYTYDTAVYTVRFEVSAEDDKTLSLARTISRSGAAADAALFVNAYKTPPDDPHLPQTGLLWWPVPLLLAAGLSALLFGFSRRRRQE